MSCTGRGGMGVVLPYAQQGSVYCRVWYSMYRRDGDIIML